MFNFLKKNAIFSVALSIGSLLVPVFFAYAETLTVTPEIVIPLAPVAVVVPPKISVPVEEKTSSFAEKSIASVKDFSAIFTDGFAVVGNDVGTGMYASVAVYEKVFSETSKNIKNVIAERNIPTQSETTSGAIARLGLTTTTWSVHLLDILFVPHKISQKVLRNGSLPIPHLFETFGNATNTVTSFLSTGATVVGTSFETAFANTKNSYAGAFSGTKNLSGDVAVNFSKTFDVMTDNIGIGMLGSANVYGGSFSKIVSIAKNVPNINQIEIIGAQNLLAVFTDGTRVVGGYVVVGVHKNYANAFIGVKDLYHHLITSHSSFRAGTRDPRGVTTDVDSSSRAGITTRVNGLIGNGVTQVLRGFAVIADDVGTGMFLSFETYGNAFPKIVSITKNIPNINQIEIIGAQNLLAIFTDGFAVVGNDVKTGILSSTALCVKGYRETSDTLALLGNAVSEKTSNLAVVTLATRSSWDTFWCWAKGLFGFDCPALNSNIAVVTPKVVSPSVKVVTPNVPDGVANPVRQTSPETTVAVAPVSQNKVLSYSSILASLKNIFAPISLTDILSARITALENKSSAGGTSSSEILALQNQINAINASRYFSPSYSYTPTAMIGGNGQAVVFNASGPNGVFENGVTAQTGTFTSGITAGSFSTAGTLSVTGATTLSGAFNGGDTLYIDAVNGRVGVGTSTPTDTLSVNGPMYFAPITPSATVGRLYNNGGDLYWAGNLIGGAATGNWVTDGTNVWRTAGNVGIGNVSPSYKLDVTGAGHLTSYLDASYFVATSSTATSTFAGGLIAGGATGLTVLQNGYVGIGTSTRINLEVFSAVSSAARTSWFRNTNTTGIPLVLENTNSVVGQKIDLDFAGLNSAGAGNSFARVGAIITDTTAGVSTGDFYIATRPAGTSVIEQLRVTSTGNVGIGTTTPGQKLSVAGDILGNNFIASYFTATTSTATSTIAGNFAIDGTTRLATSLTGVLKSVGGYITASLTSLTSDVTGILGLSNGGTGTSTAPTYGKVLIGNSGGTYDLNATSTLGLMNSLGAQYSTAQIGSAQTLATSTADTNLGLTIVSNGNTHTFTPYWIGTLANNRLTNSTISGIALGSNLADLTATDGTLTFSGSYNGGTARTIGLNLTSANTWTALQQFNANASTTQLTVTGNTYLATASGNVGIGTTTPGQKLSVAGDILGNNFIASYFTATTSTATSTLAGGLSVAGTAGLTVLQNGNVGIGTVGPIVLLDVSGANSNSLVQVVNNSLNSSSGGGIIKLYSNNGTAVAAGSRAGGFLFGGNDGTATLSNPMGIFGFASQTWNSTSHGSYLAFETTANNSTTRTEQMRIGNNGNVGIGTTSPYSKLSVWGTSTGTNRMFELTNSASTTLASFLENGTGYFLGNIGIGTTSPYAKLSVVGEAVADYFTATSVTGTSTFAGNINVDSGALTYTQSSGIVDVASLTSGQESFETNAGIASWMDLPVDSTPVLGTIESYIAQIDGNSLLTLYSEALGDGDVWKMGVGIGTTTPTLAMFQIQSATSTTGTTDLVDVSDISGNSYFRIKQSGKIGIGTTTPYSKLSVWSSGTGTGQAFEITNNASTTIAKFLDNGTAYFQGNVGIGTTTPGQKLSVAGDILGNNFIASYFTATTSTATSTLAGGLSVAGTAGLTVLQNGNVGIGTISPRAKFHISGGGILLDNAQSISFLNSAGNILPFLSVDGANQLNLGTSNGGSASTIINAGNVANAIVIKNNSGNVGIGTTSPYSKLSVWGTSTGTNRMFELTNSASTTLASFLENGTGYFLGNIGIGTTSPYAKLSVVGQVVADYFSATSTTATSTFAGNINVDSGALTYTQSSGVTDIATLSMGAQSFESDAGVLSWVDMSVSTDSPLGTVNSYSAQIDSNPMLTIYSESLGDGSTWKNAVGIGTTTPYATLSIQSATSTTGTTPIFDIAGLTGSSFMRVTASGLFSVTGTTTIGTTGQMAGLQIGNGGICVDSDGSCTASTTGRISSITSTVGATDLAENYSSTENLEPGDVVATRGGATVGKANSENDTILGIVSTNPGVLLGFSLDPATTTMPTLFPIALSGRVPVKVSNENGAIKIGDRLTLSSQAGIAMKATENGQTVGIALEDYSQEGTSKILTFVSLSWYQTLADAVTGDVPETKTFFEQIVDAIKDQIITFTEKITALKGMIIGSSEKPAGITIYDEETKEPFCIKVKNGTMINEPGACDKLPDAESVEEPAEDPTCTAEQTLTDGVCIDNQQEEAEDPIAEEQTENPTCTAEQTLTDGVCIDNAPAEAEEPIVEESTEEPTCTEEQTQEIDGCIL